MEHDYQAIWGGRNVKAIQMNTFGTVKSPRNIPLKYAPGDWVVGSKDIGYKVLTDEAFRSLYRPSSNIK